MEDLEATMPYTNEQLEEYLQLLDFDWDQYDNEGEGGKAPKEDGMVHYLITHKKGLRGIRNDIDRIVNKYGDRISCKVR